MELEEKFLSKWVNKQTTVQFRLTHKSVGRDVRHRKKKKENKNDKKQIRIQEFLQLVSLLIRILKAQNAEKVGIFWPKNRQRKVVEESSGQKFLIVSIKLREQKTEIYPLLLYLILLRRRDLIFRRN
uniref:Uncharacterized protein n=1 Tax=Romanomermis culicivorax TaxID=13658 RepID=A0A915KK55_ROMCU